MAKKAIKPASIAPSPIQEIFNFPLRKKYIFLAVIGLVFYANTIFNKYAFDDNLAIEQNAYVQMGVSGIPKILGNDAYSSYYIFWGADPAKQLSGGRYRPLSEIVFAIEQQLIGNSSIMPYFRHLVNVLAYVAGILAMFYFLEKYLLKKIAFGGDMAFIATFLFTIHPLHTEVVANLKSLDEILSLLFILLTFICSLEYIQNKKTKYLIGGTISFFLALLSKEYAVTLLFFIPFLFYLLKEKSPFSAFKAGAPYYVVFVAYFILRYYAVGFPNSAASSAILGSNPYLYATHAQKIATEWFVMGKYLGLLFFPYPLSYDYSYQQIPYHSFSDITVLLSLLVYTGIFIWGVRVVIKKSIFSFAILFFLLNIFMISNFVMDIGATMGERLVFHSSLGFSIILSSFLLDAIPNRMKMTLQTKKRVVISFLSIIGVVCFGETVIRNAQWKDDTSLDIHDVSVAPNSFIANNNAGRCYVLLSERKENSLNETITYRDSARKCLSRSLQLNPKNEFTWLNLAFIYNDEEVYDSSRYCYDMVRKMNPNLPLKSYYALLAKLYFTKGFNLAKERNKPREGIIYMRKALLIDSTNESIWYDLGIAYYHTQQYDSERYALMKTLQFKPDSFDAAGAKNYLQELSQMKKQ